MDFLAECFGRLRCKRCKNHKLVAVTNVVIQSKAYTGHTPELFIFQIDPVDWIDFTSHLYKHLTLGT